jgi:hypothetical protein
MFGFILCLLAGKALTENVAGIPAVLGFLVGTILLLREG